MPTRIVFRKGSRIGRLLSDENPVLGTDSLCLELSTSTKIGDGVTPFDELPYEDVVAGDGAAVADHASHTHSVTSSVAVADHAAHTHTFTASSNAASPKLMTTNTSSGAAASGTTGNPSATLTHSVTNNAVTSAGPSATLTHVVTQPSDHSYTPAGTNSAPSFTGSATSIVQPYIAVYMWKRTA